MADICGLEIEINDRLVEEIKTLTKLNEILSEIVKTLSEEIVLYQDILIKLIGITAKEETK